MSFDALTLAAVRDELEPLLAQARIQKLVFIDELSLAVELFAPHVGRTQVLFSANPDHGRIQRIHELPARGLERDRPFSLVVRKHLRNARVVSLHQPRLERVFELDCEQRDASGRLYKVVLIVEAMGRRSNLVLVDAADGLIIDAARRAPPSRNPRRPVLPHLPYAAPPPQDRLLPEALDAESLASGAHGSLAKHLADRVAGLSPLAARELAFRASGAVDVPLGDIDWTRVATVARQFLAVVETHEWEPTVAFDGEAALEYAPIALTHQAASGARLERYASISDAMEAYYAWKPVKRGDPLAAERKALLAPLERAARSSARRISALSHQLEVSHSERDVLRRAGEALLANQTEGIEVDPRLSTVENAQAYFAKYRKAREAEERVPALLAEAQRAADYLGELHALVEVADDMAAVRALRREVADATGAARPRESKQSSRSAPYRRVTLLDGYEALVGTSASGNAAVTFDLAHADDLWLHARSVPGAHVIVRGNPPNQVIERAAELAAHHSASRAATSVEVDVTQRRYVKKIPGGAPGLVRYANERTLRVTPRSA